MAADQVEDLAALGANLEPGDGCGPAVASDDSPDTSDRGQPAPHCQSCCFHHNGQSAGPLAAYAHDPLIAARTALPGRDRMLTSAFLSAEKDPPRTLA